MGLVLSLSGAAFFWQQVYYPSDTYFLWRCHEKIVANELGHIKALNFGDEQWQQATAIARERMHNRFSFPIREIESSDAFHQCLLQTYAGANLLNLDSALLEARNFFATLIAFLLIVLSVNPFRKLFRWIVMR
tara:strand:+ start:4562 stop:4960 length:399 start_codon:yes stop_codon:yes gene_type:complete